MNNFSYFKEKDRQTIIDFIAENPFAFMTGSFLSGKQVATQSKLQKIGGNSALIANELIKRKSALFPEGIEW